MASPASERKVVQAAADLYRTMGVLNVSRRDIVAASGLSARTVNSIAHTRSEFLRLVVAQLPFAPITKVLGGVGAPAGANALQLLMTASRDVWGDPASAWDPRELEALAGAQFDEKMLEMLSSRIKHRWNASHALIEQMREAGAIDPNLDIDAIVLHIIAVGVGISLLAPVLGDPFLGVSVPETAWTALSARLLESLAVIDPQRPPAGELTKFWRVRATIPRTPTASARLLRVLALLDVAVVQFSSTDIDDGDQQIDAILNTPAALDRATLEQAIDSVASEVIVARGNEKDATDVASRVLKMSSNLVQWPEYAPQAAADLVLARSWEVTDSTDGENSSEYVLRLQWTLDNHVILRRDRAPFTKVEYQRASALLELVEALTTVRGIPEDYGWVDELSDDTTVWVRLARPEDTVAVEDLHRRCSPRSIYQRYFTPKNSWREENLRRVSGGHRGITLVVTDREHTVIALGNIFPLSRETTDVAEIAFLVDDSYHRRGIGSILINHSEDIGARLGFKKLIAYVLNNNAGMQGLLLKHEWQRVPSPDFGPSVIAFEKILADNE